MEFSSFERELCVLGSQRPLKILPAGLDVRKLQGTLTGTGAAGQGRARGTRSQVWGPPALLPVPVQLRVKVAAVMLFAAEDGGLWPRRLPSFSRV